LEEIGIDVSGHRSKHVEEFLDQKVHTVVTVCASKNENGTNTVNITVTMATGKTATTIVTATKTAIKILR
jgi:protein-tyrosine-phosphatase